MFLTFRTHVFFPSLSLSLSLSPSSSPHTPQSDSCGIEIPELELQLHSSGAGRYTTIEGLIDHMKQQLTESNPFGIGDSASSESRERMQSLIQKLDNMIGLTIILNDPAGNSWCSQADGCCSLCPDVWWQRGTRNQWHESRGLWGTNWWCWGHQVTSDLGQQHKEKKQKANAKESLKAKNETEAEFLSSSIHCCSKKERK